MLTKGIGFPVFLILGIVVGLSYAALTTLFHSISSLLMVFALQPLIRQKWKMLICFVILLFLPVTFSIECYQRVYRNSVTIWQVLLIISSLSGMMFRLDRSPSCLLTWALPGIIGLSWLFHTREDAVWILPFAGGMWFMSCVFLLFVVSWKNREFWLKGMILLLPLTFLLVTIEIISALNYCHNGFWGTTIFASGPFPGMVRSIYQIRWPDSESIPPRIAVSRKQLQSLYAYSPTMSASKRQIEKELDVWSRDSFRNLKGGWKEVENGWIFWAMLFWPHEKHAARANLFYAAIADELNSAVAKGQLKTRRTMPSALMAPWKPSALPVFKKSLWKCWKRIRKFQKITVWDSSSKDNLRGIRYLENFTGTKFRHCQDLSCSIRPYETSAVKILKAVIVIYQNSASVFNILGWTGFLLILIKAVCCRDIQLFKVIIFLLGLLAACALLIVGVSYTHATGFDAIYPCYLAGGYPISLVFNLTALFVAWNILTDLFRSWRQRAKE